MTIAIPAARQKLIERIATARAACASVADPLPADDFIRQYYHGVAEEDLAEYRSEELAAAALAHLRFGVVRKPAVPLVRVYNAEEARDGWTSTHTVVEVTVEDMPFLVDSLGMVLTQAGLHHPPDGAPGARRPPRSSRPPRRARRGRRAPTGSSRANRGSTSRSIASAIRQRLRELEQKILRTLERRAGWQSPTGGDASARSRGRAGDRRATAADRRRNEVREVKALLEWMADNHFTFLGYRQYRLRRGRSEDVLEPLPDTGLGILRARRGSRVEPTVLTGELRERARAA